MKHLVPFSLVLLPLALTLSACNDNNSDSTPPVSSSQLKRSGSASELATHIRQVLLEQYGTVHPEIVYPVGVVDDAVPGAAAPDGASAAPAYSTTNTQESEVDEADRLKNNGEYLYVASAEQAKIRVFKPEQASAPQVGELTLPENTPLISGLYLHDSTLVAMTPSAYAYPIAWRAARSQVSTGIMPPQPYDYTPPSSHLFLMDVSQPATPIQTSELSVEGDLVSSRMIGSTLYMATRHTPTLPGLDYYPITEEAAAANRQLINQASLADFLPNYSINGVDQGELFSNTDCFVTDYSNTNYLSITSLVALDVTAANPVPQGQCFMGDTETLYASSTAVYLATTQYTYDTSTDANGQLVYSGTTDTDLHKFALSANNVSYRGSGRISGHLGWNQDLKPFRLSEYKDTLRVITYTGDNASDSTSTAHLYNLQENAATQTLEVVGELPNSRHPEKLGKPGEQIYATRFMGDRGYLVTFRTTDPLYMLDLSRPKDPTILSELQIDGYSDYLHPISANLLLGIGKDAVADTSTQSGDENRGAWYQGVKLSLIDVSDPQHPLEKQKIILGKRGSETAVSQTQHALTSLLRGDTLQVALPVSVNENLNSYTLDDPAYTPANPSYYYAWTRDELQRLDINTLTGDINVRPALIAASAATEPQTDWGGDPYSWSWPQDRSVMIGDYVYYLHGDKLLSSAW